jgi:hypothetical protein
MKKAMLMLVLVALPRTSAASEELEVQDLRAAMQRYRKIGQGTQGTESKPMPERNTLRGKLIRGDAGDVLVERTIDPETAELLLRMGWRQVSFEGEIQDKTILGDKVYVLYDVDSNAYSAAWIRRLEGQQIELQVRYDAKGTPVVTWLGKAE